MNRRHTFVIALFLALAVAAGMFAALRTTELGASAASVPAAQLAARSRALDRYEASLRREAPRRPPALPAVPAAARAGAVAAPRVVYVRPAPVVHVVHRHHSDDGEGDEHEGGGLDD